MAGSRRTVLWLACALLCPPGATAGAARDSLAFPAVSPEGARLSLTTGTEFEGERQVFGFSSLFGTAGGEDGPLVVDSTRYRERATAVRALLGIDYRAPEGRAWSAAANLEARLGASRRALYLSSEAGRDSAALRGLRLRHLLSLDDQDEEEGSDALRSAQSLLHAQWNPGGAGAGRDLVMRAAHDLSRASADGDDRDSTLAAYADYLDYQRASLGVGWVAAGLGGSSLHLDLSRKWAAASAIAYRAAALTWSRSRWSAPQSLDLEARLERRRYDDQDDPSDSLASASGALSSYDEAELLARFTRRFDFAELQAELRLMGDDYEDRAAATTGDSLLPISLGGGFGADRLRCEAEWLLRREMFSGRGGWGDPALPVPGGLLARHRVESLELGIGLRADLLWVDGGDGSWRGAGIRLECRGRAGPALGEAWWDLSGEIGRRVYPGDQDALVFEVGSDTFSLAQSDFTFGRLSLVGGGRLPLAFRWEASAFLDREAHDAAEDDIDLFTIRIALLRRWGLIS